MDQNAIAPVGERQRIGEIDVLRGIALFGVLTMNFVYFAGEGQIATKDQLAALPTAGLDWWAYEFVRLFIGDKANTVFATLFGLGFYLQMQRGEGRPGFERRFARRLFWLLMFGIFNSLFLWFGDILNLYAVAGFGLLLMRKWRTRSLLLFGIIAALYSYNLQEWLLGRAGIHPVPDSLYGDPAVLHRQEVAVGNDYWSIVTLFAEWTWLEWLAGGMMAAWVVYALGRFALGAAIGRSGLFDDVPRFLPLLRRIAAIAIPLGIALGLAIRLVVNGDDDGARDIANILRSPVALVLAAGYCAGIVVALQRGWGRALFGPFAAVGRMALTNYLAQGFIYAFVLFGVGPGLGLAGRIGSFAVLLICVAFFAFQVVFSHWWLARFQFGPMEWLWRWLTYGERPPLRRASAVPQAA
ncbi:DUF418 domain-containing protein [Sphingomonas mesophila]|uniref:DUF418 domain-containing protein n=1 Tax=Sphingomonas mesophila TaxID=2303576 RepID=UPI000E568C93|nr:DUF418 domain-containing protein [Sphingomonas mesophila]